MQAMLIYRDGQIKRDNKHVALQIRTEILGKLQVNEQNIIYTVTSFKSKNMKTVELFLQSQRIAQN